MAQRTPDPLSRPSTRLTMQPRRRRATWLGVGLMAGLAWLLGSSHALHPDDRGRSPDATSQVFPWLRGAAPAAGAAPATFQTGLESLPRSLQGTEVDGELTADAQGHLVLTRRVRAAFDYFLSAIGEEPLSTVRARLAAYIHSKLPPVAAQEALLLLDHYLAYKQALDSLIQQGQGAAVNSLSGFDQRLALLHDLRRQHLSAAEVDAFFAFEDARDTFTLARLKTLQDASLSPTQKAQRIHELTQALPADLRAAQDVTDTVQDLHTITQEWQARGGSPDELRAARVQLVGTDAADRLEALDRRRADWVERTQRYLSQRQGLLNDPSLSELQRQQALQMLRDRGFSPQEQLRLAAVEESSSL
jgi:lipase chaperone LimK